MSYSIDIDDDDSLYLDAESAGSGVISTGNGSFAGSGGFFTSNGSLAESLDYYSVGSFGGGGGGGGVISFDPEVLVVRPDGTIKKIPLNTNGFFPSRQYESDPVIYDDDGSMSLLDTSLQSLDLSSAARDPGDLEAAKDTAAVLPPPAGNTFVAGVQAVAGGAAQGAMEWATQAVNSVRDLLGNTDNQTDDASAPIEPQEAADLQESGNVLERTMKQQQQQQQQSQPAAGMASDATAAAK